MLDPLTGWESHWKKYKTVQLFQTLKKDSKMPANVKQPAFNIINRVNHLMSG